MEVTFNKDLKRGKQHEHVVLTKIQQKYPQAYIIDGYCKEYDIWIPELEIGIEVKGDEKSKYTGNIVIEVLFNGKDSGISTTKAKYWVIYDGYKYNWFDVKDIRKCIATNYLKLSTFVGKGDIHPKDAYLVPKELLYKYKLAL
jgi:hypothetical protein